MWEWAKDHIIEPVGNFFTGEMPGAKVGEYVQDYGGDPTNGRAPGGMTMPSGPSPYESYAARSLSVPNFGGMGATGSAPSFTGPAAALTNDSGASSFRRNEPPGSDGGMSHGMTGLEKAALVSNILGAGAGIYGQYKEGKARDEQIKHQREEEARLLRERDESAKRLSPVLAALLGYKQPTQMES